MNVYIDGVLALNQTDILTSDVVPNAAAPINYRLGYSPTDAYPSLTYFHGYLDDVALFRGVLSIGQIQLAMNGDFSTFQGYGISPMAFLPC